jgi:arsenite methyltransferase
MTTAETLRDEVRRRYAEAARSAGSGSGCGGGSCCEGESNGFGSGLYTLDQREDVPEAAARASLGCGNPTAVAELREGEAVLDLGSGGGIDVIVSARRVGPSGVAYGLDMTEEMFHRGRAASGRVRRRRDLEVRHQPLDGQAGGLRRARTRPEAGRTDRHLRRRRRGPPRPDERAERGSYVGCIARALSKAEYEAALAGAGFDEVAVAFTYAVADGMHGAFVQARKL